MSVGEFSDADLANSSCKLLFASRVINVKESAGIV